MAFIFMAMGEITKSKDCVSAAMLECSQLYNFCGFLPSPLYLHIFQKALLVHAAAGNSCIDVCGRFWRVGWPSCLLPNLLVTSASGIWPPNMELEAPQELLNAWWKNGDRDGRVSY